MIRISENGIVIARIYQIYSLLFMLCYLKNKIILSATQLKPISIIIVF